jgi:prevent-host-death family protein
MERIGLRELRQHASELVRRAEDGEVVLVTVSGRPAAVLGPLEPTQWRRYDQVAGIFSGPEDEQWAGDRERVDGVVGDSWR